jgi:hypothetical protein
MDIFKAAKIREVDTYKVDNLFNKPKWFIEPYVPALHYLGELRVFVVNGTIFKTVSTTPEPNGRMDCTEPLMFTPLSNLRYDIF